MRFIRDNAKELGLIILMAALILGYMTWLHWIVLNALIGEVTGG